MLACAVLLAACGDSGRATLPGAVTTASATGSAGTADAGTPGIVPAPGTTVSTTSPPTTTSTSTTTSTTTSAPTTTSVPSTTTTPPVGPWQAEGQRYYFPVQPPEAASYGATHHDYPATDVFAPLGTAVVAVTDGVVDELSRNDGWDPAVDDPATRGGRFVSVIGNDGVRYYCSHLDTVDPGIATGEPVRAGQVIGTVGNSGNAAATSPHLHFGISRPTVPGDWITRRGEVRPYDYLQAWARGKAAVPVLPDT